jgi:hypothetical protein
MRIGVIAALVISALAVSLGGSSRASAGASAGCSSATYGSSGYGYAGFQANHLGHGVRAALTGLADNAVVDGHVAAWVGVGGPGKGPNGSDEWLQVGLASFAGSPRNLYYEVTRPGGSPVFHLVESNVPQGALRRVAVLEMSRRPGTWRVWVDGRPVSEPIVLPGSSRRWQPIATAEAWDGGSGGCNAFAFRFERVELASGLGGSWKRFVGGFRFQDSGYRISPIDSRPQGAGSGAQSRRAQAAGGAATSFVAASA